MLMVPELQLTCRTSCRVPVRPLVAYCNNVSGVRHSDSGVDVPRVLQVVMKRLISEQSSAQRIADQAGFNVDTTRFDVMDDSTVRSCSYSRIVIINAAAVPSVCSFDTCFA